MRSALDRRPRRTRPGVPTPDRRAAGGLRPASPRGPATDRDRRHARHPGRDGPLATPLRDAGAARGRRGRRGAGRPRRTDGMTSERDFDRLARAWLELGPDEAPDRVDRRRPPGRRDDAAGAAPLRWPTWRSFQMTRLPSRRRRGGGPRRPRRRRALPDPRSHGPRGRRRRPTPLRLPSPASPAPARRRGAGSPAALAVMWRGRAARQSAELRVKTRRRLDLTDDRSGSRRQPRHAGASVDAPR